MGHAILPNVLAPVIVQATFNLSTVIMIEAAPGRRAQGLRLLLEPTPSRPLLVPYVRNVDRPPTPAYAS
jgi:hypothetical protein